MEVYLSEEERVEALKKWWQANSRSVVTGLALGAAILAGWNAWQNAKQSEPALKLSERLIERHQGSVYATYAALFTARLKAEAGDLAGAKKVLSDLLAVSKDDNIKHLARIRLGRVMLAMGEIDPALKLLEPLKPKDMGKYASLYEELKGDLYAAAQRSSEALAAYEQAKQAGDTTPLLEMKIDNLAVESTATSPAAVQ